jgi:fumarate reductase flavoprotein subunit
MSQDVDVIVMGAGLAGLVAGVRAAERGLRVAVLEKGDDPDYLCNTRWSGGIVHVGYTDPKEPTTTIEAAITRQTRGFTDPALAAALARDTHRVIDWLRTQGGQFIRAGGVAWQNWTMAPPRRLAAGPDWRGRGPDMLLRLLAERLTRARGRLVLGARVIGLIVREERCVGVGFSRAGATETMFAGAVVLADGGFQGDLEMLRQTLGPAPERVKQRGTATSMGDALRMAHSAGAAISPLEPFYGHLLCRDSMTNDAVWPYPELDAVAAAGMLVRSDGARFLDEGMGGIHMANMLARSPDPLDATIILDTPIWESAGRSARIPPNPELIRAGGTVHRAASLEDLASKAGIAPEGLTRAVAAHNAAIASGEAERFDPPRSADRYKAMPIATGPFLAIPVCAGITYTMGGIVTDADARVRHRSGGVIPGLYAAGSTTGGIEGGPAIGYTGGLSKAAVFGFRAAEHIAAGVKEARA